MNSSNHSNEQLNSKDLEYNYEGEEGEQEEYDGQGNNNNNNNNNAMNDNANANNGLNLTNLHNDYDEYISELKRQLQLSKELRKKSEVDAKALEHKILLLQNQEKYVMMQFLNTKKKIEQILINRSNAELNMKYNTGNGSNYAKLLAKRKGGCRSNHAMSYDFNNKRINANANVNVNPQQSNEGFYPSSSAKSYKTSGYQGGNNNNNEDDRMIMMNCNSNNNNNNNLQQIPEHTEEQELNDKKQKIKEGLMIKLKEEEEERLRLENEIAMIEKEELRILKQFNIDRKDVEM